MDPLGSAVFQQFDADNVGPMDATNAPPGSFAISAHEGPNGHPHQMDVDPSNRWVLGPDAGQDRIYVWKLTPGATPPLTSSTSIPADWRACPRWTGPGTSPSTPTACGCIPFKKKRPPSCSGISIPLRELLQHSRSSRVLPPGFAGTDFTSEIRVSADGHFVYGANRTSDTIGVFSIGHDGRLTKESHASTLGDYPRIFTIDPTGRFIAVGNQRADNVTTFSVNRGEGDQGEDQGDPGRGPGSLTFTGNYTPGGEPIRYGLPDLIHCWYTRPMRVIALSALVLPLAIMGPRRETQVAAPPAAERKPVFERTAAKQSILVSEVSKRLRRPANQGRR